MLWAVKEAAWKAAVKAAPERRQGWKGIRVRPERGDSPDAGSPAVLCPSLPDGPAGGDSRRPGLAGTADTFAGAALFEVELRREYIHAVCLLGPGEAGSRVVWQAARQASYPKIRSDFILHCNNESDLIFSREGDPSPVGRTRLIGYLNALLDLGDGEAVIRREQGRHGLLPPRLFVRGEPSGIDISLSHDGRFAAWAILEAYREKMR